MCRLHAVTGLGDAVLDPRVVVLVAAEERHPRAKILELQVRRTGGHQLLHLRVEDRRQREAQLLRVLVVLEVGVPREVDGTGTDRHLHRYASALFRDLVEIRQADRPALHGTAVDDTAPVVEHRLAEARFLVHERRMLFASRFEAWDALVHVPTERPDRTDVVVVPHVAVGDDVETGFLLVSNHCRDRVGVRLFVLHFLESHTYIAAAQLVGEPMRSRIRPDHSGGQNGLDNSCHGRPLVETGSDRYAGPRNATIFSSPDRITVPARKARQETQETSQGQKPLARYRYAKKRSHRTQNSSSRTALMERGGLPSRLRSASRQAARNWADDRLPARRRGCRGRDRRLRESPRAARAHREASEEAGTAR